MGINGATVLPTAEGQGPGLPGEKHLAPGRAYTVRTESRCAQAAGDMELPDVLARLGPELGAPSHHSPHFSATRVRVAGEASGTPSAAGALYSGACPWSVPCPRQLR